MEIKQIQNPEEKIDTCRRILTELPDWFGIPESIDDYVKHSSDLPFWVASIDNKRVGFISVKQTSSSTAEIYVMGVLKYYHNQGIGRALFRSCYDWCREKGYEYLQIKTLDKSHPDKNYAVTRKFYEAMGFRELECISEIWGDENPCLIMIMNIN